MKKEEIILEFRNREDLRHWLRDNHQQKESIWIRLKKKDQKALKPMEALEEALCYGWIDSIIKRQDEIYYLKKFSKRRENSTWSEFNKKLVKKLMKDGMMAAPGLKAVEVAKAKGCWDKQQDLPDITVERLAEFRSILERSGLTKGKFDALTPSRKKNYGYYYFMAKREETRQNRLKRIIDSIENGPYLF